MITVVQVSKLRTHENSHALRSRTSSKRVSVLSRIPVSPERYRYMCFLIGHFLAIPYLVSSELLLLGVTS